MEFNPWRFTDEASMLAEFFRLLAGTIRVNLATRGEAIAKWLDTYGHIASVAYDRAGKVADLAARKAEAGLEELRRRLSKALLEADKRIVILVDDIDRLDKHEVHTLFRLIKACADFPNVCYVLAFDDTAVAKALGERYGGGDESAGRAFLEKVIQIPLKLPVAAKEDLRSLCFEQVDRVIAAAGIELTQKQVGEFVSGFDRGISFRLTTPRSAKRYGNALMFTLPMLKGETNPADLLLIEAIRAFFPEVYDFVRDNHVRLSGFDRKGSKKSSELLESLKPLLVNLSQEHADAVTSLLITLFPRLKGGDWGASFSTWSRERRIGSPHYSPRYFMYTVPHNDVSDATIAALLDAGAKEDEAEVEKLLTVYLSEPKARRLIEKLRAVEGIADPTAAATLSIVIAKLAKNLPNPLSVLRFQEPPGQAAILISHLLRRNPSHLKRITAAKRVVQAADPLWFGSECLRWLHVTDKPHEQEFNTLTEDEIALVRQSLVKRIKARALEGAPLFAPDLPEESSNLFEWWQAEGRNPVQEHLLRVFTRDSKQVARFLQVNAPRSWGGGDAVPIVGGLEATQLANIERFIDLDTLADWVQKCCPGNFKNSDWPRDDTTPLTQRLAEQFMFAYNQ